MTESVAPARPAFGRASSIALWVVRIAFALLFLAAGSAKLIGAPMMVHEFGIVGLGQWFRYFTGATEIVGAVLLVWPATVAFGAGLLTCVSLGAFAAQALILKGDVVHTIVFAVILGAIAFLYRGQIFARRAS